MTPIGPFSGLDNVHRADARAFQVPVEGEARRMALASAVNVDLDDDGWVVSRSGLVQRVALANGKSLFAGAGMLLGQDGGSILSINEETWATTALVTGLSANRTVKYCEHAGQVFYTNGEAQGRIFGGVATNWGCAVGPTPVLATVAGSLPVGRYLIAIEHKDSNGITHAASAATPFTLVEPVGIRLTVANVDPSATHLRVFLAGPDDDVLYLLADVPVGSFPYTITSLPEEDTVCWTIGLSPPPICDFIFSYHDRLMLVCGSYIYPSLGVATHLYDIGKGVCAYPDAILAAEGLQSGFWAVSETSSYWTTGTTPETWAVVAQKVGCVFSRGSKKEAAIPGLGLDSSVPVALFNSDWGLAVGLPDGKMVFPFKKTVRSDTRGNYTFFAVTPDKLHLGVRQWDI